MKDDKTGAGERVNTRRNLRMARDLALTGAGVAGMGGVAILTRRGMRAITKLTKRGRHAIQSVARSGKSAADTAKDVLDKNVRPAVDQMKMAGESAVQATAIGRDAGRLWNRAKTNVRRSVPDAYREGVAEGMQKPRKKSLATRVGKIAGALGFESPYGKDVTELSSYVSDVTLGELPPAVRKTVGTFGVSKTAKMPRYGMVVKELVAKADPHNLATARTHVKQAEEGTLRAQWEAAQGKKYVLLLNDRIIDGHHHLAKAESLGVTSALDVLDLTPVRFQVELARILRMPTQFARKQEDLKDNLKGRARNALVTGTAGGYLGQIVADGNPLKVPVPSKLLRKLGKRGGRGMFKKLPVSGGKLGVAAGALAGLARNPKKGTATAESVATGGSFAVKAAVTELGLKDFTGANVRRAGKMLARQQGLKERTVKRELGRRKVMRNLSKDEAADPTMSRWGDRLKKLRERANAGIQKRQGELDQAVVNRGKSRKNAAVFGGGAYVGYRVGSGRKKDVEPMTKSSAFERGGHRLATAATEFGRKDQARERATGEQAGAWDAFVAGKDSKKYGRLRRDSDGNTLKTVSGRAIYDDIDVPGVDLIKDVHRKAAPIVKWGGRASNLVKDAAGAARGEVKKDRAGRPQKREWEKDWAKREGKKALAGGALLAYAVGLHKNAKVPVPSKYLKKIGAKAGRDTFTKVGMRDLHEGTGRAARRWVNRKAENLTGTKVFDKELSAQLNHLLVDFQAVQDAQRARFFEKPFLGYNEKRHARTGGLNDNFRESYNRQTGSNLKRPVTTKPSKLKPGSKAAGRRKSLCARMGGMKGATSKGGELTPKGAALKRWNCADGRVLTQFGKEQRGEAGGYSATNREHADGRTFMGYKKRGMGNHIRRNAGVYGGAVAGNLVMRQTGMGGAGLIAGAALGKAADQVRGVMALRKALKRAGSKKPLDDSLMVHSIGVPREEKVKKTFSHRLPLTQLGYNDARDEGWDLRDPRGKSARVFAPGSRKRDRREKRWHEKIGNERKLWTAGMIAAGLTGGAVARKLPMKAKVVGGGGMKGRVHREMPDYMRG